MNKQKITISFLALLAGAAGFASWKSISEKPLLELGSFQSLSDIAKECVAEQNKEQMLVAQASDEECYFAGCGGFF